MNEYIYSAGVFSDTQSFYPNLCSTANFPMKISGSTNIMTDRSGCQGLNSLSNQDLILAFCLNKLSEASKVAVQSLFISLNPESK